MQVTDIAPDNAVYFADLVPWGALVDENIFWLGAIAGDGTACATLGAGVYGDSAFIDWIYTDPSYRGEGAADSLLRTIKTFLRRVDVEVLQVSFSDDDENLEDFLEMEGFLTVEDGQSYKVPVKDLIYSEMLERFGEEHDTDGRIITFSEFDRPDEFYDYLERNEIPPLKNKEDAGSSLIRINKDGSIDGCMLITRRQDRDLEISYLLSEGLAGGAVDFFLAFKDLASEMDWQEDNIIFTDRSGEIIRLIGTVAGVDIDSYTVTERKLGIITL